MTIKYTTKVGKLYWKRQWAYIDALQIVCTFIICSMVIDQDNKKSETAEFYRWVAATNSIAIWFNILYFMKLHDKIFPFIYIMFTVVYEIGLGFFLILFFIVLMFANVFWLMGRNVL